MTALQGAALHGRVDIISLLLSHGADVNAPAACHSGGTALQLTSAKGYIGVAVKLLKAGADVNAAVSKFNGNTALEAAAANGRISMVQLLVDAGATIVGEGSEQYDKAVQLADEAGFLAVRELLKCLRAEREAEFVELESVAAFADVGQPFAHFEVPLP